MNKDVFVELSKKSQERGKAVVSGLAEMFGIDEEARTAVLPISKLREKENHPFKVIEDASLYALAKSIKENGLIQPVIVRPLVDGYYEILAGHRRTRACKLNGDREINAIIIEAEDELANRIMIATNFLQRECHLASEIARSYLIRYTDLMRNRAIKEENSHGGNEDEKIKEILEKEFSASKSSVYRYLRLNNLIPELLDELDDKKLNIKIAVELSYLDEKFQRVVYDLVYDQKQYKLDLKKAVTLKKSSEKRFFNEDRIKLILTGEGKVRKNEKVILTKTEYGKYMGKFKSADDMKKAIIKFLEEYNESE